MVIDEEAEKEGEGDCQGAWGEKRVLYLDQKTRKKKNQANDDIGLDKKSWEY